MRLADENATGPMQQGTRIHTALEAQYGYGVPAHKALATIYDHAEARWPEPADVAALRAERETSLIMVSGYLEWVDETGADANLRVVATERDIRVPMPGMPEVLLRAKLDQVVLDEQSGMLSFLDHKTSASFEKHEHLVLDPQFRHYALIQRLARPAGAPQVYGGIMNTLRRVKRSSASKPPYYQRDAVRFNDEAIEATLMSVRGAVMEIVMARSGFDEIREAGNVLESVNAAQRLITYPNPRVRDCSWDCPFTSLCPMMDDGSDWVGALIASGRYAQGDPYGYYGDSLLPLVLAAGKVGGTEQGEGNG
jgi:hypothetical protein